MSPWRLRRDHRLVFRGIYLHNDIELTTEVRARAALLAASDGSYISHHTAAALWSGVVPDCPDIHVSSTGSRGRMTGIVAHRAKRDQVVTVRQGVRLTAPIQTFLDLSQVLNLLDLVVLGDSLVKKRRCRLDDLLEVVGDATGPGAALARRAAALVREGVDSPMESRLRMLIVLAGLPEPQVDHRIYGSDGALLYRFDLAYVDHGLIIEYDGWQHADERDQWERDVSRDEELDNWRIRRLVVFSKHIYNTPAKTLARIIGAMRDKGMTIPPLSNEWRRYFPSKPWDISNPT
jgi:hypothetical protein